MDHEIFAFLALAFSFVAILVAAQFWTSLRKLSTGTKKVEEIGKQIKEGAMAFLAEEYKVLAFFIIAVVVALGMGSLMKPDDFDGRTIVAFLIGAFFSALAGNVGMRVATDANTRTATAVKHSMGDGLKVAFSSGSIMGLLVVGLGLLGVTMLFFLFGIDEGNVNILFGFGFGASSIALFARVGGGIYTKSADVGADLVGKVEAGIPEDDPRNPAVIADNVGDNVGDVAGMGADLFESYVDSIIAAMALGYITMFAGYNAGYDNDGVIVSKAVDYSEYLAVLPLFLAGVGILCSLGGILFVQFVSRKGNIAPEKALNYGTLGSALIMSLVSLGVIWFVLDSAESDLIDNTDILNIWGALLSGLGSGLIIGFATEYFTSDKQKPVQGVAEASETGAATNIIAGLALGMNSTIIPVLAVCLAISFSYHFAGMYGIGIAAVGMLSILGMTLSTDTYGPVADNAAGIAEMAGLGKEVRERAETLDAVGNTTAAVGKGFAIGSAGLTALALFSTFKQEAGIDVIDVSDPPVLVGLFIGALLPFVFSALTMSAVGNAAKSMIEEVRRQFRDIPGLKEGKPGVKPDSKRCVEISTQAALKEMILPSVITIVTPIAIGFWSLNALGGLLAGSVATGFVMAVFMANSGGAWDNAKKYIEAGHHGGKGSDPHKAAVVGDTVGDPFKDTSGPSLNILIKLMSIVALVFLPFF